MTIDTTPLINNTVHLTNDTLAYAGLAGLLIFCLYEALNGRYRNGRKTREDWAMGAIAISVLGLVQRPLLLLFIFSLLTLAVPHYAEALAWLEQDYLLLTLVFYTLIDEYLHGRAHLFTHSPRPKQAWLKRIQTFYKIAHRPHHQIGGNDGRGELSATQTYVEHWGWWLILPNYWFGIACLYFGLYETFLWGTLTKSLWGMHVHTNWGRSYDLVLLNHPHPAVRKLMTALCHVFTFPNMHHQHHSRGPNSAKNMTNFIALFDWLLWDTLVIEKERPATYGWRQTEREEFSPLYRYFNTSQNR